MYANISELFNQLADLEPKEIYAQLWELFPGYTQERVDEIYHELMTVTV